jgi:4-amino-4-deoxy-L-arabinose transferase-like glycosyltransferase
VHNLAGHRALCFAEARCDMDSLSEPFEQGLSSSQLQKREIGPAPQSDQTSRLLEQGRPTISPRGLFTERWLILATVAIALVYLGTAGVPRLFDQIDGQYAGAAREMLRRNDWLVPTQNGVPRLQKPPLVYWAEITTFSVFGVNEFAARLPVALATLGWIFVTAYLVYRLTGIAEKGWCAGIILSTFAGTFFFSHMVMPEPFLALLLALTMLCLVQALQSGWQRPEMADRYLARAWLAMSLGCLAKGLHGLAIPLCIVALSAWLQPTTRPLWRRFFLRPYGWILLLAILLPWYALLERRFPGFLLDHLWNEQIGHVFNRRLPPDSVRVPFLRFFAEHLGLLFPWSLFLPAACALSWKPRPVRTPIQVCETQLLGLWLLVSAVGVIFSSIQDYYLMSAWPVLAFWLSSVFIDGTRVRPVFLSGPAVVAFLVSGVLLFVAFAVAPLHFSSQQLTASPVEQTTIVSAINGLPPATWSSLQPLLVAGSLAGLLASSTSLVLFWRRRLLWVPPVIGITMAVVFALGARSMSLVQDVFSSERLARFVSKAGPPSYTLVCECESNDLTSLFFYLQHPVYWINAHPETEFATRVHGLGRNFYLNELDLRDRWSRSDEVFLLIEGARLGFWESVLGFSRVRVAFSCGSRLLITNR